MKFTPTSVAGAYLVEMEKREDNRGFFARAWCAREFANAGLNANMAQINVGFSVTKGTLRGLHYQLPPADEAKTVRCTQGAAFDVVVDLRPGSPTWKQWFGVDLTAENRNMLYIPEGCAHGYQTLTDGTEVLYQTSQFYSPESARGVRYDDPAFGIRWPMSIRVISQADKDWPPYTA